MISNNESYRSLLSPISLQILRVPTVTTAATIVTTIPTPVLATMIAVAILRMITGPSIVGGPRRRAYVVLSVQLRFHVELH